MKAFHEPEVVDPRELEAGDEVAFSDSGNRLQVMVGDAGQDAIWRELLNKPGETKDFPEWDGWRAVPRGNVALQVPAHVGPDQWVLGVFPRVLARRAVQS